MRCCGISMIWQRFGRDQAGRMVDVFACTSCGRVAMVACPEVSRRYLRGAASCT